jgi:ABC-type phosphate transport system permease subunit
VTVVAHAGAAGLVVEALLAASVIGVFAAVWLRERRAGRSRSEDEPA